jgi:hypothetical protein
MRKQSFQLVFALLLIAVTACSSSKVSERKKAEDAAVLESTPVITPLSEWLIEMPQSSLRTIGISRATRNWDEMYSAAREMAAVQFARNLSSYNIDNYIYVEKMFDDLKRDEIRSMIFQVSDTTQLWEIYERLELQEYYVLHNSYLLALFELSEVVSSEDSAYNDREVVPPLNLDPFAPDKPVWYEKDDVIVAPDYVYSRNSVSSACLIDAWNNASQQARLALAAYFSTAVESVIESSSLTESERQRRVVALETLYNVRNIELNRSYLASSFRENSLRYTVYVEMKIKM